MQMIHSAYAKHYSYISDERADECVHINIYVLPFICICITYVILDASSAL